MTFLSLRPSPLRWLILAGALHLTLTVTLFLVGHFQLLPAFVDPNGTGLTFAIDANSYRSLASQMVAEWQTHGFDAWLAIKAPLHCRLYSLFFAVFGRLTGHNILATAPLNLFYYLGTLGCVYLLGRELFDSRAGLLAAIVVGAWPSFLLHSTQLIRDPISILCLLALLLVLTLLLSRDLSWRASLAVGIAGVALATLFWLVRGNMWNVVIVAVGVTIVLLLIRMVREAKLRGGNSVALALILVALLLVPTRFESTTLPGVRPPATPFAFPSSSQPAPPGGTLDRIVRQIGQRRAGFRGYTSTQSNIDSDVRLTSIGDIVRFIPRAAVIGFFTPFPAMWFERGSFGLAGRLLSGFETLAMYFVYVAAAVSVWRRRRQIETWLTFLVATTGIVALGLVVVNAGALYRLRYAFWIMMIVLAAKEIQDYLTVRWTKSTN